MKKVDLLAASALSLLAVAPAHGQSANTSQTVQDDQSASTSQSVPATQSAPSTTAAQAPAAKLPQTEEYGSGNEIIVTATRRDQTVQNVPIAITALNSKLLQDSGVKNVNDLQQLAPSLQTTVGQSSATGAIISIRGVGTEGDNPGFEPAVGVFIDGVFRARAGIALAELPELDRVEVLRGPQGTLFGRNTSAGAISIFTAKPKFEYGGYVEGNYGNYDAYEVKGAVYGPISKDIALRVDGEYRKRDGYIKDANSDRRFDDIDRYFVRGQALYDNHDNLTFRLIGDYYKTNENCCAAVNIVAGPTAPAIQAIAAAQGLTGIYTGPPSDRIEAVSPGRGYGEKVQDWGVSGQLDYNIGDVSLASITAYRDFSALRNQDIDYSGIDRAYRQGYRTGLKDFTQEVRLQGSLFGGTLDWLVGAFYLHEDLTLRDTVRGGTDSNTYVDAVLGGALRSPTLPNGAQFFGSLGPNVPLFGQVLLAANPVVAPPPAPGAGPLRLGDIAPPGSPLFNYLNTPLTGSQPGQGNNDDNFRVRTNAFALFTHNIVNITDKLSLTLGLRWNYEKKKLNASINDNTAACAFFQSNDPRAATYRALIQGTSPQLFRNLFLLGCNPAVNTEFNGTYRNDRTDSVFTGTAKIAYEWTPHILTYASYDRGFKSGGFNLDQATFDTRVLGGDGAQASDLAFGDETVDAYEIGLKTSITPAFSFNLAGFYEKFHNLQSLVFSGNNFVVQNIDQTVSRGIEAESIIQPVRDLTFRLGYTYTDAFYDSDLTGTPLAGLEGKQILNEPKHVVTISGTWEPPITDRLKGLLHVDMRYNSEVFIACPDTSTDPRGCTPKFANGGRRVVFNPAYPLVSARVGLHSADDKYQLEFYVENLTNQYYNITGFAVPEQTGTFAGFPGTPRFYGVQARVGF